MHEIRFNLLNVLRIIASVQSGLKLMSYQNEKCTLVEIN
jgi:hypothetical protein